MLDGVVSVSTSNGGISGHVYTGFHFIVVNNKIERLFIFYSQIELEE